MWNSGCHGDLSGCPIIQNERNVVEFPDNEEL